MFQESIFSDFFFFEKPTSMQKKTPRSQKENKKSSIFIYEKYFVIRRSHLLVKGLVHPSKSS